MARLILFVAVVAIALIVWYKIKSAKGEEKKKLIITSTVIGVLAVLLIMGVTGHLSWLGALIGAGIAALPKLAHLLRYLPLFQKIKQDANQGNQQQAQQPVANQGMSRDEALQILNLKPGASREEILQAHKCMMQKVHPDRGGSDYLAAQINQAKETLLNN